MGVTPDQRTDEEVVVATTPAVRPPAVPGTPAPPPADTGRALAAFYDRRAPAALAYCARVCEPEAIADAVEEAFGQVFATGAGDGGDLGEDALEARLREAVRAAAVARAPKRGGGKAFERRLEEAQRAYDALAGDDAPALGRSLLAEVMESQPAEASWFDTSEFEWGRPATAPAEAEAAEEEPEPEGVGEAEVVAEAEPAGHEPEPQPTAASPQPQPQPQPQPDAEATPPARRRLPLPHLAPHVRKRVALVMLVLGTLLLTEAIVTVAWKEPLTGYLAARAQDDLRKDLDKLDADRTGLGVTSERQLAAIRDSDARTRRRMALLAGRLDGNVDEGEALGRLKIDKLDVDLVFVQGTDAEDLRKAPGHYWRNPETGAGGTELPGEGGTVGIAGHRTTYGAPFRKLDELEKGDRISLRMPYGLFTYEVTGHRIVKADYTGAFAGTGDRLVLSACHPLYSAEERILVDAKLVSAVPLGAAIESDSTTGPGGASEQQLAARRTAARLERLGDRNLGPGMSGPDVRELQRLLGMPVTGTFDEDTTAAVLAFQRDHGLPQVGRAGSQTKRALARRKHPPSRPPTPADVPQQKDPDENGQQPYVPGQDQQQGGVPPYDQGTDGTQGNGTYTPPPASNPEPAPEPSAGGPGSGR